MRTLWRALDWSNHRAKALAVRLHAGTHPKHRSAYQPTADWVRASCRPTDYLLDLGCGQGHLAVRAAEEGWVWWVSAIDKAPPTLSGRRFHFSAGDLERPLAWLSGSYHVILALDVVEHLHHRSQFLAECYRILAPGGRLLITAPNGRSSWRRRVGRFQDADHKVEYESAELFVRCLERAGFVVTASQTITYDTPLAGVIDLTAAVSMRLYERLSRWRAWMARRYPEETTGWRMVALK